MFQIIWKKVLPVAMLLAVILTGPTADAAVAESDDIYAKIKILSMVLHEIQEKYVEDQKAESLIYGAIEGMVRTLDPHSSFMSPEEMKDFQMETRGNFSGVGIEITTKDDILTVVSPIEGTPAYRAGVEAGDQIIKIDGQITKDMTLMDAVRLIRGEKGSSVVLSIQREGEDKLIDISIVRDVIPLRSVRYEILEPGYAYLRITNFQGDTTEKTVEALEELQSNPIPIKGLIMDLRNNPGGLLDQSVRISDLFLAGGLVVFTKGKIKGQNMDLRANRETVAKDYPMVVLVNGGSASASEIVAGALQDQKRAIILGTRTFGKGSVQTIIPLPDGSGLRLTTARYFTPSGRSIQATGIVPDVEVPDRFNSHLKRIREKDLDKHLRGENEATEGGSASEPEEEVEETPDAAQPSKRIDEMTLAERLEIDPQLKKALEMLKAHEVQPLLKAAQRTTP